MVDIVHLVSHSELVKILHLKVNADGVASWFLPVKGPIK